ncbi:hypothetical protein [Streptomyces sp. NPDC001307]|uniref:hypothetical protein n=1 Tax=Streptomyces sp. NPDC001307 TaxID=3364560 RepID=UPI0036A1986B
MSENSKVTPAHRQRAAVVYVRRSTLLRLERNKESTARQYDLVEGAVVLGWSRAAIGVVDEDQGHSGSSTAGWSGFAELAARIGLGQVGSGSCWPWRSAGWPATMRTGTGSWTWPR